MSDVKGLFGLLTGECAGFHQVVLTDDTAVTVTCVAATIRVSRNRKSRRHEYRA